MRSNSKNWDSRCETKNWGCEKENHILRTLARNFHFHLTCLWFAWINLFVYVLIKRFIKLVKCLCGRQERRRLLVYESKYYSELQIIIAIISELSYGIHLLTHSGCFSCPASRHFYSLLSTLSVSVAVCENEWRKDLKLLQC